MARRSGRLGSNNLNCFENTEMKRILFAATFIGGMASSSFSQTKAVKDTTLNLPSVHCAMAKAQIETYLNRVDGVTFVNVQPKKKQVRVKFLNDRTNVEAVKTHIANVGYTAEEVAANPESFKQLPACCKKPGNLKN